MQTYARRIMSFFALKDPYMYDMVFNSAVPDVGLQYLIQLIDA